MKLDRNINPDRSGKYALILLRNAPHPEHEGAAQQEVLEAFATLQKHGMLDFGATEATEFFVMRLKDKYAGEALHAYANLAEADGNQEWAKDVRSLAYKADSHPGKKLPD